MVNVKGKWALITGASRGIGYLCAIFMAKQGCNLVLHSRNAEHCQHVVDEVKALGVDAYTVEAELSDMAQVERMCKEIDEKGTPLPIPYGLEVNTTAEMARWDGAVLRRNNRKSRKDIGF